MHSRLWHIILLTALTLTACSDGVLKDVNWRFWNRESPGEYMVASAHPHATRAGLDVLARGGNAIDAAIAVQMVLTVVEPQSSGIGGGAFLIYFDPETQSVESFDGRETAPASLTPDIFLDDQGKPKSFFDRFLGGKSVGVPGAVAMLEMAHREHGNLPWAELFDAAINLAENGFEVSPKLHRALTYLPSVSEMPDTRAYLTDEGVPYGVGTIVRNPELADSFRKIARGGAKAFYQGDIADAIIGAVAEAPVNPSVMTHQDLLSYEPKKREAVCGPYRDWRVCGMGPPSSGGLTTLQILGLLEPFNLGAYGPGDAEAVHLIMEASRLAYADRGRYMADSDFVDVPLKGLIDKDYLASRALLIDPDRSMGKAQPGVPPRGQQASLQGDDRSPELPSTSHFSIMDGQGRTVSMTTTIEFIFGSHIMAGGFLLNNQLTDFSAVPEVEGRSVANAPAPGKRPRSSMSPTIVFDEAGQVYLVIGSPGGSRIISYVTKTLIGVLDWQLDLQSVIDLPNMVNRNGITEIEPSEGSENLKEALEAMGHEVKIGVLQSGLHGIRVTEQGLEGGADPHGVGTAESD